MPCPYGCTSRKRELSKQAVEFSRKASKVCLSDRHQAKYFRQQAREASKHTQVLIQELKRQEV